MAEQYKTPENLRARIALHERFSSNPEPLHRWIFGRLGAPAKARVLELGCGPATFWLKNAERVPPGWRVTLSDLSLGMVQAAREAVAPLPTRFAFEVADVQNLPFSEDSFDLVMANHMLYHVPDVAKALAEVRRVLKPGGRFYAATNGVRHLQELEDFVQAHLADRLPGLEFERLSLENFTLENGEALLADVFEHVEMQSYPDALEVTEAEPLLDYILSMRRTQALVQDSGEAALSSLIAETRRELERRLERGPIRIRKATGLFIAS